MRHSPVAMLPERARIVLLTVLQPVVFPVYDFVDRWYHTEARRRLAYVQATALWWRLQGDEPNFRGDDPRTAEEVIDRMRDIAAGETDR